MRARAAALTGSLASGVLASACCLGPALFALLGISGAALAQRFEPLRPCFLVASYSLLGGAFYLTYRAPEPSCGPAAACQRPGGQRAGRVVLWTATAAVGLATAFPWYAAYLF